MSGNKIDYKISPYILYFNFGEMNIDEFTTTANYAKLF